MGGCVASRLEEEEEVVSICRERKQKLKFAVERRYALADAHYRYCQALYGVSAAIRLFVARHSSPASPFMITFPPPNCLPPPDHPPLPPQQQENVVSNPLFLQQAPSLRTTNEDAAPTSTSYCHSCDSSSCSTTTASSTSDDERGEEKGEGKKQGPPPPEAASCCGGGYYNYNYMEMMRPQFQSMMMMPPPSPPHRDSFGWDFFDPFSGVMRTSEMMMMMSGGGGLGYNHNRLSEEEEDLRVLREREGIPELEEDGGDETRFHHHQAAKEKHQRDEESSRVNYTEVAAQKKMEKKKKAVNVTTTTSNNNNNSNVEVEQKVALGLGLSSTSSSNLIDSRGPERGGRELLEALQDIEDYFVRAYDAGKEVSRMLEVNRVQLHSNLEEIKENSTKMIQAITWRSTSSSSSSSCKSLVASSSSKSSLTWTTEFKNDLFDDYGGMDSGSHSLTLGRIYAWEKKLYEEVKAGDNTRKLYERKCNQLRNQDARGDEGNNVDKTRASVKDLYSRILVAIRSAETISQRIEKLRDEELQPQIMELLQGMMRCWKIMLESHEIQYKIIFEVKTFTCPLFGKFCNDSHRLSTLQLGAELRNWRTCFVEYVVSQKAYVEALLGWISKFVVPEVEFYSRSRISAPPCRANGPPLLAICRDWLASLEKLPDKGVASALRSCEKDVRALWVQQGEEQQQKRKVDSLSKELDRKILAFQKAENRFYELKLSDHKLEVESDPGAEYLKERKELLDSFRKKVELEKETHQNCMQETQRITLNGFQTGFGRVFESMTEFSRITLKMCNDVVSSSCEDAESFGNTASLYSEGSQLEDGKR